MALEDKSAWTLVPASVLVVAGALLVMNPLYYKLLEKTEEK